MLRAFAFNHIISVLSEMGQIAQLFLQEMLQKAVSTVQSIRNKLVRETAAITLAEIKEFGYEYGGQVVQNAQALAKALDNEGFTTCAKEQGYTKSHTILVDISPLQEKAGLGKDIEEKLGVPITLISTGPELESTIDRRK